MTVPRSEIIAYGYELAPNPQKLSQCLAFFGILYKYVEISMAEATDVLRVPPKHEYAKFVPHVDHNPEGLRPGQKVKVTPTDSGKSGPQLGELLSLNYEQVCLRNEKGLVMHFPRLGCQVTPEPAEEKEARL